MYEYQKRSNSATLTRVPAYQKKQAQETENSSFGEPIPAINPEPASTNTKKRPLPSQMLRASIARMEEARSKQNDSLESGTQADTALYQPMQQDLSIQKKCSECDREDSAQRQAEENNGPEEDTVQRKTAENDGVEEDAVQRQVAENDGTQEETVGHQASEEVEEEAVQSKAQENDRVGENALQRQASEDVEEEAVQTQAQENEEVEEDAAQTQVVEEEAQEDAVQYQAAEELVEEDAVQRQTAENEPVEEETVQRQTAENELVEEDAVQRQTAENELVEEDAVQRQTAENELVEEDAVQRQTAENELVEEDAVQRQTAENELVEEDAVQRQTAENELVEEDAVQRQTAENELVEEDAVQRQTAENEQVEEDAAQQTAENEPVEEEVVQSKTAENEPVEENEQVEEDAVQQTAENEQVEEDAVQSKTAEAQATPSFAVQPKANKAGAFKPQVNLQPVGAGSQLPAAVQRKMEKAFQANFSNVRIHEGSQAKSINALAYAQGNHIHFAPGQYNPTSEAGQKLLGHELTHVVQQREGRVPAPQGKGAPINADPGLEAEADELGAKAAKGESVTVAGTSSGVQRQSAQTPIQRFKPFSNIVNKVKNTVSRGVNGCISVLQIYKKRLK